MRIRYVLTALVFAAATGFAATTARAEPTSADKESSRALYAEGIKLLEAHDAAGAERACRSAYKLVTAPTPGLCLGRALVGLGKLVEAREILLAVARVPAKPDEPAVITTARETAGAEAEKLVARIPTITISVSGPPESAALHASIDGAEITSDTIRVARKVNPGGHVVVVGADGFEEGRESFELREGETRKLDVVLHPSATTTNAPKTATPTPAYVAFGVGGAGLGLGAVFAVLATQANGRCPNGACPSDVDPTKNGDIVKTDTRWAVVGFAVAFVGGGLGAFFLLTSPKPSAPGGVRVTPWLGAGTAGVAGRF